MIGELERISNELNLLIAELYERCNASRDGLGCLTRHEVDILKALRQALVHVTNDLKD